MAEIDSLEIVISTRAKQAERAIDNLTSSFVRLGNAMNMGAISTFAARMQRLVDVSKQFNGKAIKDVAKAINDLAAANTELASSGISGITEAIEALPKSVPDFTNLSTLSKAAKEIGGKNGSNAGQAMIQIANGLHALDGINVQPLGEETATLTKQLRALGSKSIVTASKSLVEVANGLTQVKDAGNFTSPGLTQLAQALASFGRKSAQTAVTTIPQIATAFRGLIDTLSTAPNISQKVIDLANAMANLAGNMQNIPTAVTRTNKSLKLFHGHAHKAQKSAFNLAATIGKLYATYWAFLRIGRWFGSSMKLASDLVEVQNVVDNVFTDMSDKMEDFAKTSVDSLGMSELTAKQIASRFQAMGVNMGVPKEAIQSTNEFLQATTKMRDGSGRAYADLADSMADVSLNLTKLTGDMASFYNLDYKEVAQDLESVFTGMTKPLRQYGLDITEASLKEFALRNGLDANIKKMTQYEKALLRYQYVMANTTAAHGDFIRTQETWANQIKIAQERIISLKKVLGTIGVNTFKPLVKGFNNAMNTIIHLAESTLNALGKIFGWKVEIADVGTLADDTGDMAENMDDAAGSAKKMKDYMLGIDELNVFNEDNGGGGGGGDIASSADAATDSLVKWEETEKGYESIYDTLFKLGKRIAEVEKEWLQGIDWDSIYEKASKFGKGLASFLNGYLSDAELFYEKGRFIARTINTIATALKSFAEEFDGYQFGVDIGSWINGFTYNIGWDTIQKAAYELAHDIAETINGAVKTTDWTMVGRTIANAINTVVTFASTLIKETDFAALGKAFANTLNGLIHGLNAKEIAVTLREAIHGIVDFASETLSNTDFLELGKKMGQFLKELKLMDYVTDIARLIGNVIVAALKLVPSMILEAPFESALLAVIGVWKFTHLGSAVGLNLANAISTGLKTSLLPKISYIMTTDMAAVWSNATIGRRAAMVGMGLGGSIVAGFVGFNLGKGLAYVIADLMGDEELKDIIRNLGERWGEIWSDGIVEGAKQVGAGLKEMFAKDVSMDDSIFKSLGDKIDAGLYEKLDSTRSDIYRTWSDVLDDIQKGIIRLEQEDFQALKDAMSDANINAVDAINMVNQLKDAQKNYYELFPAWLEQEKSIKAAVDSHGMSRETAYQIFLNSIKVKQEDAAVTDILTSSENTLADATGTASDATSVQSDEISKLNDQLGEGESAYSEYLDKLYGTTSGMNDFTESTKKTGYALAGVPSYLTNVVGAMNESSEATMSAEEESAKFQDLWSNYTISNVDISQLHEINTVLEDINATSTNLVKVFEDNFGKIFGNLEAKLGDAKTVITTFDGELNELITTLFEETIPTDFETTTENLDTFLKTSDEKIGSFDEELGKKINTLFDETLPGKFEGAESAIGTTISNVQKKFEEFLKWFDKNVFEKTKAEYWTQALSGVSGAFDTTFRGVANTIVTIMNSLIEQINSAMNIRWDGIVVDGKTVMGAGSAKLFEIQPIPMFERGGFPEDGLFYANHNELVGGFANGKTAVANNEQIISGIREGVEAAMSDVVFNMLNPYLSDIAQSSRETANKDFSVNIGDRDIAMANNRGQSLVGMNIIS